MKHWKECRTRHMIWPVSPFTHEQILVEWMNVSGNGWKALPPFLQIWLSLWSWPSHSTSNYSHERPEGAVLGSPDLNPMCGSLWVLLSPGLPQTAPPKSRAGRTVPHDWLTQLPQGQSSRWAGGALIARPWWTERDWLAPASWVEWFWNLSSAHVPPLSSCP